MKELYLDNTKVDYQFLKEFSNSNKMINLELLSLRNCKFLTSLSFATIHCGDKVPNLKKLFLDYNKIEIKVEIKRLLKKN